MKSNQQLGGGSSSLLCAFACAELPAWDALLCSWTCPKTARGALGEDTENVIPVLSLLLISHMTEGKSLTLSKPW